MATFRFYGRERQLESLQRVRARAAESSAQFTLISGRKRIGKTHLIREHLRRESSREMPGIYLAGSITPESMLAEEYCGVLAQKLDMQIPMVKDLAEFFRLVATIAETRPITLVVDEFQDLTKVSESLTSKLRGIWDIARERSKLHLIVSGSMNTMINKIFRDSHEPLFGRIDQEIRLRPFKTTEVEDIFRAYSPGFKNDDLLAFYAFTGGIPKYMGWLIEADLLEADAMMEGIVSEDLGFLNEGSAVLQNEFAGSWINYFNLLLSIAIGRNTWGELAGLNPENALGQHLKRLEEDFKIVGRLQPLLAKPGSRNARYEITDLFFRFWFRFIHANRRWLVYDDPSRIAEKIKAGYPTYSGYVLEQWFVERLRETQLFDQVGPWWQAGKGRDPSEIDIVAVKSLDIAGKEALAIEVKQQRKAFHAHDFLNKVSLLERKALSDYSIKPICLTTEDMMLSLSEIESLVLARNIE